MVTSNYSTVDDQVERLLQKKIVLGCNYTGQFFFFLFPGRLFVFSIVARLDLMSRLKSILTILSNIFHRLDSDFGSPPSNSQWPT